ncbi:MAG: thiamine phosphate synthase [Alphaproteobacteria bacterium]|jgi:thiamine-phosphate pyrophosphorylase|nr:thiamine phosphate synthase [Alphaproteobacteria bacterium]
MVRVSLEAALERSFDGGCRWVVIREKDLDSDERMKLVETILKLAEPYNAKILVNADMKAAEIAHGVHLPQGQSCTHARATLGPDKIIGVSAHSIGEAGAAASAGADYATISPMFPTQSKPGYGPPLYLDGLKRVVGKVTIPLVALGGVTAATALSCRRAGASGVAVMGTIMRASDPAMAVYDILNQWYAGDNEAA